MQINVAIEKLSQTFFRQWLPRGSLVWSFWLLMFWWQWYWWYLTRTSVPVFLKLRLVSWSLWFYGMVFENFIVSLGANKTPLFNEVWSKVDGFLCHLFKTSHFNKSFFYFWQFALVSNRKVLQASISLYHKGHNIVLLLHWINVCSTFMLNTTVFCICLRFLVVCSLQINMCCFSEQRVLSVINGFLQSRLPPTTVKCFTPVITFELS